jgi:cell division septum initiation protein DivIVA
MTDVQGKLDAIVSMVEQAKTKPLSGSVVIPRADLLTALGELREQLPAQLAEADKVLRERRSLVEGARTEAERLVSDARRQSERAVEDARRTSERMLDSARQERQALVDEASVLAEAEDDAEQLVAEARAEALRMRAETDDYVDASLARFEALLEHTLATVGRGRDKLRQMSDSALQQEFPDPDGEVGMPAAPPVGLDEALGAPEVELSDDPELPAAVQPTLSGELLGDAHADGSDQSALAR